MVSLQKYMSELSEDVNKSLERLLVNSTGPEKVLQEAMRYSTLNGGKRLRPFLLIESAGLFGVSRNHAMQAALAIELIHCYSLVHDDLPAMDDDDLRRGRPTCHKAYDEATAILVGDALLTKAFEILADPLTHSDAYIRCQLISKIAKASGDFGMIGGQMFDLLATHLSLNLDDIKRLQSMKTGQLITFSCEAGAILGQASESEALALTKYSQDLGLAFQIADDLLDVEGNQEEVGKELRKDNDLGKATFVSLLGVEEAHRQAQLLVQSAISHIECFNNSADRLRQVAQFVIDRRN